MATPADRLARDLVRSALEFHKLRLWTESRGDRGFLVRLPDVPDPLVVGIFGQLGQHFGLSIQVGAGALEVARDIVIQDSEESTRNDEDPDDDDAVAAIRVPAGVTMLSLSFDRLEEIPPDRRAILTAAGFTGRRESIAPTFVAVRSPWRTSYPNRTEMRLFVRVLNAVRAARAASPIATGSLVMDEELPVLRVGADRSAAVERGTERVSAPWSRPFPVQFDREAIRRAPQRSARWVAGFFDVPQSAEEPTRRPLVAFGICEEPEGLPIHAALGNEDSLAKILHRVLDAMLETGPRRRAERPREIVFLHRGLERWLAPVLADLGVACAHAESSPAFTTFATLAADQISTMLVDVGPGGPPDGREPQSLADWKAADRSLCERIEAYVARQAGDVGEALEQFFGDAGFLSEEHEGNDPNGPLAFVEWYAVSWRAVPTEPTLVERWLDRADFASTRTLLEARMRSRASIYRVDRVRPGADLGLVDLVDLVDGERRTLVDSSLSSTARPGDVLPLRLYTTPAGDFGAFAGPPMTVTEFPRAIEFLEVEAGPVTSESLNEEPERLGRLFKWITAVRRSGPPRLANTDGEPLAPQTAEFMLADRAAVLAALRKRKDLEPGEHDGEFIWSKSAKRDPDERTLLARIVVSKRSLDVEVNSDARLTRVREWLDAIPGVRFKASRKVSLKDLGAGAPGGATAEVGEPLDAATEAALREFLRKKHFEWLDEPVPALGDRTPREAVRNEDGRRRVAMLIRSMPAVMGPGGASLEPPREEMLRALGIERDPR